MSLKNDHFFSFTLFSYVFFRFMFFPLVLCAYIPFSGVQSQWNEPWNRKYTKKSTCLPLSQVQRLGRQILEALLFLRERGFPSHGHLHSGNVILQNGVARYVHTHSFAHSMIYYLSLFIIIFHTCQRFSIIQYFPMGYSMASS